VGSGESGRDRWVSERTRRGRDDDRDASFRTHFGTYLLFGVFFFVLNLLTNAGDWWFYWPLFGWGIAIVAHAFATYGADAPVRVVTLLHDWLSRMVPLAAPPRPRPPRASSRPGAGPSEENAPPAAAASDVARIVQESEARVDAMRRESRRIPKVDVRAQALDVCAAADRVLAVLAENPAETSLARDFLTRYLTPAEAILSRYTRLATRGVATAEPTLVRVEREDLPLLDQKFKELFDRLHRGDLIDLEVAREMLQLDFATAGAAELRIPETRTGE
jgi:hypothetical protein